MKKALRKLTVILLTAAMTLFILPLHIQAETINEPRSATNSLYNYGWNNYDISANYRWDQGTNSYLFKETNGFLKVQCDTFGYSARTLHAEYYDNNLNYLYAVNIPVELQEFGSFYATDDRYFIVSGQNNPNQDNNLEVLRITEYDHNWNRIASDGVKGGNTTKIFYTGANCTAYKNIFIVRTSHEMYKSSDGYNHEANMMVLYNTTTHKITEIDDDSSTTNYAYGRSSHSFAQQLVMDGSTLITADHGDAYPRSIFLHSAGDISYGRSQYVSPSSIDIVTFEGALGGKRQ